jgi:hypothetical protein
MKGESVIREGKRRKLMPQTFEVYTDTRYDDSCLCRNTEGEYLYVKLPIAMEFEYDAVYWRPLGIDDLPRAQDIIGVVFIDGEANILSRVGRGEGDNVIVFLSEVKGE